MRLSQEVPALFSSQPSLAPFKGKSGGRFVAKLLCNKNTILLKTPKEYCSKSQSSQLPAHTQEVSLIPGLILTPELIKKNLLAFSPRETQQYNPSSLLLKVSIWIFQYIWQTCCSSFLN